MAGGALAVDCVAFYLPLVHSLQSVCATLDAATASLFVSNHLPTAQSTHAALDVLPRLLLYFPSKHPVHIKLLATLDT